MKKYFLIFSIFLIAFFVRNYDFPNRVIFWTEQARSLITSASYMNNKFSFLGQEYFRQDSNAHTMFSGALFNYFLVPLLYITGFNPVMITFFFLLLNLFTGYVTYWIGLKIFNKKIAIMSAILFLFNSYMIYHSLFIWNYNLLPLVGLLIFYLCWLINKKSKLKYIFCLGLLSGFGFSLQVLFLPILIGVLFFIFIKSKRKVVDIFLFVSGCFVGNFPMIIFDLRHDFYHIKTLTQYLIDTISGKSDAGFAYYYLFPFWGVMALLVAKILSKLKKFYITIFLLFYILFNLNSKILNQKPMINIKMLSEVSNVISKDAVDEFNIASTLDFDKRAYPLRYFLKFIYNKTPRDVTEYSNIDTLFVIGEKDYNFDKSDIWEIKTGWPYKIEKMLTINDKYELYKLTK